MESLMSVLGQIAQGSSPAEPMWFIEGVHEGSRSLWIAVCSDGAVQRRSRGLDALPSSRGQGREDYDVEALGTAAPQTIQRLAQVLLHSGLAELAKTNITEGPRYTLKLALAAHRIDLSLPHDWLRSYEPLRILHETFEWVAANVTPPDDDDDQMTRAHY